MEAVPLFVKERILVSGICLELCLPEKDVEKSDFQEFIRKFFCLKIGFKMSWEMILLIDVNNVSRYHHFIYTCFSVALLYLFFIAFN